MLSSLQAGVASRRSRASRCWMAGIMQGRPQTVQTMGPQMRLLSDLRAPCSCMVSMTLPCSRHNSRCSIHIQYGRAICLHGKPGLNLQMRSPYVLPEEAQGAQGSMQVDPPVTLRAGRSQASSSCIYVHCGVTAVCSAKTCSAAM